MPTVPISMRKLKEILRLKYGAKLSHRQIARSLSISPSAVSLYANRAAQLGIKQWPLPTEWDPSSLRQACSQTKVKIKKHSLPNWAEVHKALRNKIVTLQLLWEEYAEQYPGSFYSYNHYCRLYREWLKTTNPSMRQVHKAGEKLFVDYCGPTINIINPNTGETRTAQLLGEAVNISRKRSKTQKAPGKYEFVENGETKTWTGKGRKPKPIAEAMSAGRSLDEFLINK